MQPLATKHTLIHNSRIAYGVFSPNPDTTPITTPIVLLHGTPSSSLIWRNIVPSLTAAGYKVYLFDLLGYGLSERPWDSSVDTSISGQVRVLTGLLEHWGLEETKFHLVAHDFGGGIAQRFGVFYPGRLASLTMMDVVSFDSYPSPKTREVMANGLEKLIKASDGSHREHFREWLLTAVHDKDKFRNSSLDTFLEYISGPIGQGSLFEHQIRTYDPKHTLEVAGRLSELGKVPVKIIWGADDAWQVKGWGEKLHEAIPGSTLEILENCGHFSPEDQPERIVEILLAFLEDQV
ncbi:alpha/beta hydrolase [Aspergillus unguis]